MRRLSILSIDRTYSRLLACLALCLFSLGTIQSLAQQTNLVCNTYTPLVSTTATSASTPASFSGLSVTSSTHVNLAFQTVDDFSNKNNLTDGSLSNLASFGFLIAGSAWIEVKDNNATGANVYPAGSFAGFAVDDNAIQLFSNVTITTYNSLSGTAAIETKNSSSLISAGILTGIARAGFITTKPFDRVRIEFTAAGAGTINVYYAIVEKFCAGNDLVCNTKTPIVTATYPVSGTTNIGFPAAINYAHTGVSGATSSTIANADNIVDSDPTTVGTITAGASGSSTISVAVQDQKTDYAASVANPIFAGFDIQSTVIVGLGILDKISIKTYLNGVQSQSVTGSSLLVSVPLLSSSGRQTVGFVATAPFDEVQINFNRTGLSLGTIQIYNAIFRKLCESTTPLACNTATLLNDATQPVLIDINNTGTSGAVCVNCNVSDPGNAIDGDASTAASVSLTAGVSVSASLAVKKELSTYPASSSATSYFVGFDIENPTLVGANLLGAITIQTLLNGVPVETVSTGSGVVSLGASLLSGTGRQTVGFVATSAFNGIKITLANVASLNLGQTKIYSAIIKKLCAGPTIACSTSAVTPLTNTTFPVYINTNRTGTGSSLACVGCAINDAENVIDGSTSSPATISLGAAVSATARLSVANPLDTYPAESYVGFDIESNTLVGASLLGRTRITLYNNGSAVQTGSGASLLAGVSLVSGGRQTVGTVAQVPFDEVEIEFSQLVSANPLGTVSIYRAVIQKACVTPVACNQTKVLNTTDFSAFIEGTRTGLFGGVSANLLGSGVSNPGNAISPNTSDFARITNVLGVGVTASISVADPADVYPAGTFAGYTISKANLPVSATLFSSLTVTTYLNGVLQESSATTGNLIDLSVFLQIFGGIPSSDLSNVGFVTSKSFDEIQLSVGSFTSLLNYVDVYGAFIDTRTSSNGGSLVCNFVLNPDFNVTNINVPISGNVSTNDKVSAGTTYGTPVASGSNPSGATIALTTTGTYSFTATTPGNYTYTVSVCATGQTSCPTTPLIITVLDQSVATNKPVANPDYASVQSSTATAGSVVINVKANDGTGNPGGILGTPTVIAVPAHGSVVMSGDNVVYTPTAGYIGDDVLTYQVCETPGGLCATAQVTVHVVAPGSSTVTVADDYISTTQNAPVASNVLTNDQGAGLTVSNAGTITSPGKGTLIITSTGSYTFTPTTGVTGPVDFTYTACDGGAPASCGTATLHILVKTVPDLVIITNTQPSTQYGTTNFTTVGEVYDINSSAVTGSITVYITKDPLIVLSFDSGATFVGGKEVSNSAWTFDASGDFYKLTTNAGLIDGVRRYGLKGVLTPGNTRGGTAISSTLEPNSGGELNTGNNSDSDAVDYFNK